MQEGKNRYYNHGIVNDVTMLEESINLSLENSSIFFTIFFRKCFSYYLNNHLFKKVSQLKGVCWVILDYSGTYFARVPVFLRAVRPCLKKICKDVVCITPMLTARVFIFTTSPLLEIIWGIFWSVVWCFFSIYWKPFRLLWNFVYMFLIILRWLSD